MKAIAEYGGYYRGAGFLAPPTRNVRKMNIDGTNFQAIGVQGARVRKVFSFSQVIEAGRQMYPYRHGPPHDDIPRNSSYKHRILDNGEGTEIPIQHLGTTILHEDNMEFFGFILIRRAIGPAMGSPVLREICAG